MSVRRQAWTEYGQLPLGLAGRSMTCGRSGRNRVSSEHRSLPLMLPVGYGGRPLSDEHGWLSLKILGEQN
jgi:hypothetical protein